MANLHKGEFAFEAAGRSHVVRFSANALCELETQVDLSINEVIARLQNSPRLSLIRALLWAGLTDTQPGITLHEVGLIIDAMGLQKASAICGDALIAAFPDAEEGAARSDAGPPQGAGIGPGSTQAG